MTMNQWLFGGLLGLAMCVLGCAQGEAPAEFTGKPSAEGEKLLLAAEPEGAADVIAVRESAKNDDVVAIVGRIGGKRSPWVTDMAAFTIVDPSLKACSDIEEDECPTPWDYCCETPKLKTATALVQMVDAKGVVIPTDARKLLGVKELATVVVHGKAVRDKVGNLTILADGIHVRP